MFLNTYSSFPYAFAFSGRPFESSKAVIREFISTVTQKVSSFKTLILSLENIAKSKHLVVDEFKDYDFKLKKLNQECVFSKKPLCITFMGKDQLSEDTVEFNLQFGQKILEETVKTVRFSPNNLDRSRSLLEERANEQGISPQKLADDFNCLKNQGNQCLDKTRKSVNANYSALQSSFSKYMMIAKVANEVAFGNCMELAASVFFNGMEIGPLNAHFDIVRIVNGDHNVMIMGRQMESDPSDYTTWGPKAIVIDPWAGKVYKASEIEDQLIDYAGTTILGKPVTKPFDPKTQRLQVIVGNIYFPQELLMCKLLYTMNQTQSDLYDEVIRLLKQFHQSDILQERIEKAQVIYQICCSSELRLFGVFRNLMDQTAHFIELAYHRMQDNTLLKVIPFGQQEGNS